MRISDWSSDVCSSDLGKVTDYARAAHKKDGETVVYSWVEWPDKETRAKGWAKMMTDERMKHDPANNPFDGERMINGGFRSEERRVGKEGVRTCRSRWSRDH